MKTTLYILIGLVIAGGAFYYFWPTEEVVPNEEEMPVATMKTYTNPKYGLSFSYPENYQLTEHDAEGSAQREHHVIVLMRTEDLPLPEAGEGPPSITIEMFQNNLDSQTTEGWIRGSSASNFKLGEGRLSEISLDGKPALSYRWSGLYEGTTVAIAQPRWIYAFSVTYLEPGADIVQDFVTVRDSVKITP